MSRKIIGVTVGTTLPKPNFKQTDPTKGDYIKNKPDFDGLKSKVEQIEVRVDTMQENAYDDTELRGIVSENVAKVDTLNELVGNTKVETQINNAVTALESEIDNKFDTMQSDIDSKVDAVDGMGLSTNDYTTAEKDKLATVEPNANFYEHPVHDSHSSGLYKVTVDASGHVSGATLAEKEDIVALGIPAQDTTYDEEISDLSDRIDGVEDSINTTNEAIEGVTQEFENYKTTNNEAVSTNASGIEANKTAIEAIQGDYLTSTDKTQLQDDISKVSEKATTNASAIEILNGEGDGSVKQSIDNAFNEFAANVSDDKVVNTYKELIDYAATHGPEFTELVGKVDTINTHVGEIEVDLSDYKTSVSDQFAEVDTTINDHITDTDNPHSVTKEQIGLSNVDDTSDLDKPISNAMQEALDEKADLEHAHSDLYYDKDEIEELVTVDDIDDICGSNIIIDGGNSSVVSYATKQWVQDGYQPKGNYLTSVPDGYATESYVDTKVATIPTPDVSGQINTHNLATDAHNDIRLLVDGLTTRLNTLADCDDATLDQMSEVVEYIKSNQSLIEGITTKKVNVADIVDNLTTNASNKPLSASQGVVLKGLIDELTSNLSNYQPKGDYLTAVPTGYATEEFVTAKIAEAELSSGSGSSISVDTTLTQAGAAADAKAVGDAINNLSGLNDDITEKVERAETAAEEAEAAKRDALTYKNDALASRSQALSSASNAATSKTQAALSATNASKSATKAEEAATRAEEAAIRAEEAVANVENVDLTGYATESWVGENYQPKGNYLTEVPEGYAKTEDIPTKPEDIGALPADTVIPTVPTNVSAFANDAGYLTEHQSLDDFATELYVDYKIATIPTSLNLYFYESLSTAISDINNSVIANAIADNSVAKVKVFHADNGRTTVMLLDDISESVQIDINKDIDLVLNGKILTFTTSGAYLNFALDTDCTINGEVNGSLITKNVSGGIAPFYLINSNGILKMKSGNYHIETDSLVSMIGVRVPPTCSKIVIEDCTITARNTNTVTGTRFSIRAIQNQGSNTIVNNSIIKSITTATGLATSVTSAGVMYINNSKMFADAPDYDYETRSSSAIAVELWSTSATYCNNAVVYGTHSGLSNIGKLYINGGTYAGFCHGGIYFAHGSVGEAFVNDATIRCGYYEGEFDYSEKTADILGSFYIGGGTSENNSNVTAYLDNCIIDSETGSAFVLRGTSGETNNTINISNPTILNNRVIRIDPNLGHKLNIGVGGESIFSLVNNSEYAEVTNELYRRNHEEKVLDGNDFNALLNVDFIKNKPEIATDEEIIEMLTQLDMLPTVADSDGAILADENGDILLW